MAESIQLSRIAAIMLGVRDLAAAIAFYKDKLGLNLIMQEPALALLQCGNVMLGLSPRHINPAPLAEAVEVSFGVDNLRATHKALGEKGVKTHDDLADLAGDELREIVGEGKLTESQANAVIMAARASWFAEEEAKAAASA